MDHRVKKAGVPTNELIFILNIDFLSGNLQIGMYLKTPS